MSDGFARTPQSESSVLDQETIDRTRALAAKGDGSIPDRVSVEVNIAEVAQVLDFVKNSTDLIQQYNKALPIMPEAIVEVVIGQVLAVCKNIAADVVRGVDAATRDQE